jgi:hypothetical protein
MALDPFRSASDLGQGPAALIRLDLLFLAGDVAVLWEWCGCVYSG